MNAIQRTLSVLRNALLVALEDFKVNYTWKTWTFGWMVRMFAQAIFFAMIGRLLGSPVRVHYLLVGNAVMIAAACGLLVVASTTWERRSGTLPLLVAAPGSLLAVFMGRSVEWVPDGFVTSLITIAVVGPLFGLPLPLPRVLWLAPLVLLVTATTYCFGTFLAAWVLRAMEIRNLVSSLASLSMMAICGVNVPLSFYPAWLQAIAQVLPVTHGLQAIRDLLAGASSHAVWTNVGWESAVGLGWLLLAVASFRLLAESGRKDGSIEFAD
jgi:ABC-2 type transport system permease protein